MQRRGQHGSARLKVIIPVVLLLVVLFALIGLLERIASQEREPTEQPIAFSHKLHAGDKQIPCQYCHAYARRGPVAGVPSVERCLGCHAYIATKHPEIKKLAVYWERKQPIPWIRIHNLPDFVYFSHKRHIRAGLECQMCHGPIETMPVVYQYSSLEMGWCLSCHRQRGVSVDCATCHK